VLAKPGWFFGVLMRYWMNEGMPTRANYPEGMTEKFTHVSELLPQVFAWAREANPSQPLTSGVWTHDDWSAKQKLNVIEQVSNACQTTIARDAWERGQALEVHGWIYGLQDGLLRDLKTTVSGFREAPNVYRAAVSALSLV